MKTQVSKDHYFRDKYATLERFISYFYQIDTLKKYSSGKILFIGVGDGIVPDYLKNKLGIGITTYDFDANLSPDVIGDVRNLPFKDSEFDTVAAFEVLEHIPFEDFPKALAEISRVTKSSAIISIPRRYTGFEFIFKFPFMRTLLKRDFLHAFIGIPMRYPGFESSGQHYWEIDNGPFKISRIRDVFKKYFRIMKETSPVLHSYQKFFILEKYYD